MPFIACELEISPAESRPQAIEALWRENPSPLLVLDTCQRLECFGRHEPNLTSVRVSARWNQAEAFERLARIAAGLESRVQGELEILGQVRAAYRQFQTAAEPADSKLDRIFQDALALARQARKESGIDRSLTSLSGLAARTLLSQLTRGEPLAVVGAGSLAGSVVRYLGKRGHSPVRVASRCPENAIRLALEIGGFGAGLDELDHLFSDVAGIVTATSAPHPVVYAHHLARARRPLTLIDLGVPSDCAEDVRQLEGVHYITLRDIESQAQVNLDERRQRAEIAARCIQQGAQAWAAQR